MFNGGKNLYFKNNCGLIKVIIALLQLWSVGDSAELQGEADFWDDPDARSANANLMLVLSNRFIQDFSKMALFK